jgi:hypothetical protein
MEGLAERWEFMVCFDSISMGRNDFRSDRLKKLQNQNLKDKVTNESKIPE